MTPRIQTVHKHLHTCVFYVSTINEIANNSIAKKFIDLQESAYNRAEKKLFFQLLNSLRKEIAETHVEHKIRILACSSKAVM